VGRRLILDTNVLIAYERGTIDRTALDDDELAVAAITMAEYRVGIELPGHAVIVKMLIQNRVMRIWRGRRRRRGWRAAVRCPPGDCG
jgi:predicted nucleic acid-binding protein